MTKKQVEQVYPNFEKAQKILPILVLFWQGDKDAQEISRWAPLNEEPRIMTSTSKTEPAGKAAVAGKVVLVMQGGGAQAAYEGGVYEALHRRERTQVAVEAAARVLVADRKPANMAIGADVWKCGEPAHDPADRCARFLFTQHGLFVGS
jgi:hypothetical protein